MKVKNPALKGFNPDPAIVKVDDTFYIATSTFETYPGLSIHESKDMVNWHLCARPLTQDIIDMTNNNPSSGVWAPDITYHNGEFYIVFSNVETWSKGPFKDVYNYIIHSKSIHGPWSKPAFINSSGFDASLFHDDDGKSYFVNQETDYRGLRGNPCFTGILVQEIDLSTMELKGECHNVFKGTERGFVEGPHIYKKDGYYYLFCAEGGTGYNHAESVSRSKNVFGPYETHPQKLLISAKDTNAYLQKAGHCGLVDGGPEFGWYLVHLCSRPIDRKSMLGRETSIQNIYWENGWPYLKDKSIVPYDYYTVPYEVEYVDENKEVYYDVNSERFDLDFQSLRISMNKFMTKNSDNSISLVGRQSLNSYYEQVTLERRVQHFKCEFGCKVKYNPTNFGHMAGIMIRYQEGDNYFIYMSYDEQKKTSIRIFSQNEFKTELYNDIVIPCKNEVYFKITLDYGKCLLMYSLDGVDYKAVGPTFDATLLSDEIVRHGGFTGAFFAIHTADIKYAKLPATFSDIYYKSNE